MPSQKILEVKKQAVAGVAAQLKGSVAGVLVNYSGINVADDTKLRKELREAGVQYAVVKNSILKRAVNEAGLQEMEKVLEGTTALATSEKDYSAAARILCKFAKDSKNFEVKSGYSDGKVLSAAEVEELSKLPNRDQLVAMVAGALNSTIASLAIAINAIVEKNSEPAEGAEAPAEA
jgi:large subunit ribosomal protein L10